MVDQPSQKKSCRPCNTPQNSGIHSENNNSSSVTHNPVASGRCQPATMCFWNTKTGAAPISHTMNVHSQRQPDHARQLPFAARRQRQRRLLRENHLQRHRRHARRHHQQRPEGCVLRSGTESFWPANAPRTSSRRPQWSQSSASRFAGKTPRAACGQPSEWFLLRT